MTEWKREGVKAVKETRGRAMKTVPILRATETWKASPIAHRYTRNSVDSSSSFVAWAAVFLTHPDRAPVPNASPRALAPTPRYADGGS